MLDYSNSKVDWVSIDDSGEREIAREVSLQILIWAIVVVDLVLSQPIVTHPDLALGEVHVIIEKQLMVVF